MDIGDLYAGLNALDAVRLLRNPAAAGDTYAADARLFEFDIHYRKNKLGSAVELPI